MRLMDFPLLVLGLSLVFMFVGAHIGDQIRKRFVPLQEDKRNDFGVVLGATLALLALLPGFSFSISVSRYDQRKNYEEAEANAIGTEYVRADLLPSGTGTRVRELLRQYTDQRVLFYTTRNPRSIEKINADTAKLQKCAVVYRSCPYGHCDFAARVLVMTEAPHRP